MIDLLAESESAKINGFPAWTIQKSGEIGALHSRVSEAFRSDPEKSRKRIEHQFSLGEAVYMDVAGDRFVRLSSPAAKSEAESLALASELLDFPVEQVVQDNLHRAKTAGIKEPEGESLSAALQSLAALESRELVTDQHVKSLASVATLAEGLVARSRALNRDSKPYAMLDSRVADYLKENEADFLKKIRNLKTGEESLYLSLPVFDVKTGELSIKTHEFVSEYSFRQVVARYSRQKIMFEDLKNRSSRYVEDYAILRSSYERLKDLATDEMGDSDSAAGLKFFAHDQGSELELSRFATVTQILSRLSRVFSPQSLVHPSLEALKVNEVVAKASLRKRSAIKSLLFLGGGLTILGAGVSQSEMWNKYAVQPYLSFKERDTALDEDLWIAKCSKEESLEAMKECVGRYREVLTAFLNKKYAERLKNDPTAKFDVENAEFDLHFFRVMRSVVAGGGMVSSHSIKFELAWDYEIQDFFNKSKKVDGVVSRDAVAKKASEKSVSSQDVNESSKRIFDLVSQFQREKKTFFKDANMGLTSDAQQQSLERSSAYLKRLALEEIGLQMMLSRNPPAYLKEKITVVLDKIEQEAFAESAEVEALLKPSENL